MRTKEEVLRKIKTLMEVGFPTHSPAVVSRFLLGIPVLKAIRETIEDAPSIKGTYEEILTAAMAVHDETYSMDKSHGVSLIKMKIEDLRLATGRPPHSFGVLLSSKFIDKLTKEGVNWMNLTAYLGVSIVLAKPIKEADFYVV